MLTGDSHATGQAMPYQPLVQALRLALPLRDRWSHVLPIWLAEVSRLLPELCAQFPDLPPPAEVASQQAQARLFEALTQVFGSLTTDSPLLLCLDDGHWADEATLGWLQYVTKRLADTFMENYGPPATGGFCPPGMPGHSADIGLPYDPDRARQLLAEAGYPEGRDFLELNWLILEFLEPLAGYLQEQWQTKLGIGQINKKPVPLGALAEALQQEQPALLLCGWVADYPDPDSFLPVTQTRRRKTRSPVVQTAYRSRPSEYGLGPHR